MSKENVEVVREAMDAYHLGDRDRWAQFMDPELETFPVPEFPEPGPLIGPDAAWDFYQRFGETMAGSELYENRRVRNRRADRRWGTGLRLSTDPATWPGEPGRGRVQAVGGAHV